MPDFPIIACVECVIIDGADARRFAQAQLSGDVTALASGHWQWNAWLSVQGRVQALMHLADPGDGRLVAVLRGGNATGVRDGLARYRLRSEVGLAVQTWIGSAGGPCPYGVVKADGNAVVLGLGTRSLRLEPVPTGDRVMAGSAQTAWRLADIKAGWPTLPADGEAKFLPPDLGLERLGAVSFRKGCYPGQEIAARMHFRGVHKRQLCHLHGATPLAVGDVRSPAGSIQAVILDTVAGPDGCDALAIAASDISCDINILDNTYDLISTFLP